MRMWQSFGDKSSMEEVSRPAAVPSRSRMLQGIKPEMMHKVLSSISVLQSQQQDDDDKKKKKQKINDNASSCKQFGGPKLLELFPERKSDEQQQQQQKQVQSFSPDLHGKHGTCKLLTIFYNGAVNVYAVTPDKAQEITDLANSILCKEKPAAGFNTDLKAATAAQETLQFAGGAPASEKVPGVLTQVRKQSLQRFLLQKRKDRLNSVAPFPVVRAQGRDPVVQTQSIESGGSRPTQTLARFSIASRHRAH